MLILYPSSNEKSIYATIEPFDYEVSYISPLFLILNLKNNFLSFQIWIGIIFSLLTVSVCSWFILFISARFLNSQLPVERTAAKLLIYFFKVIVQQGTRNTITNQFLRVFYISVNCRKQLRKDHPLDWYFGLHLEPHCNCHRQRLQFECRFVFIGHLQETGSEHLQGIGRKYSIQNFGR